jgi:ribonuclease BN (tRNA processing enzyme)
MKVKLLGSSVENTAKRQYVSSYVINGNVGIDAGCLGFYGTPQQQECIKHLFLTHSHADHVASLAFFVENAWTPAGNCPVVYGIPETLDAVQRHIFNDVIWPDFVALSSKMPPFLRLCSLQDEVPVEVGHLRVTPVRVNHLVPTVGFLFADSQSSVIFSGDTGPTTRLWEIAREAPRLRAVLLEVCFPNSMRGLAEASLHLTPEMFGCEAAKLPPGVKIIAVHIKVRYRELVIRELEDLGLPNLEIGECEKEYEF